MPTPARNNQEARRQNFKKAIDADQAKQKRQDQKYEFSKSKREESLQKRRNFATAGDTQNTESETQSQTQACTSDQIPQLVQQLFGGDANAQLEATTAFRKMLSMERSPPIDEVIQAGVIPQFVNLLQRHDNPQLQFEAAWALTNVASGTSEHTNCVVEHGAVPVFVSLVLSPSDEVKEQAIWALGNIAGDSPRLRDVVLQAGVIAPTIQLMQQPGMKTSMLRNCTWSLSNFCRGKPQPDMELVRPALPILAQLCWSEDDEVVTDACWGVSYLSDGTNDRIQAVIDTGVSARLIQLLTHPSDNVKTPALRSVGNIVTGNDRQTQAVLDLHVMPNLLQLLHNSKKSIRKEVCWTISNITAGSKEQIQEVINHNAFPAIIHLLSAAEFEVKKEAAWALSNATSGGAPEQIKYIVERGAIGPLCELLAVQDARIVTVALEGLENILRHGQTDKSNGQNGYAETIEDCDGLTKIEELQHHANERIYETAVKILETYFEGEEDDDDMALAPGAESNTFSFGLQAPIAQPIGAGGFDFSGGMN